MSGTQSGSTLLQGFRDALSLWPSGVTIATTVDDRGQRWGFTASAFSSLSLDPPLVLVCLDAGADSHQTFSTADRFAVNVLRPHHQALALRFATKGDDKFAGGDFVAGEHGCPVLPDAVAVFECERYAALPGGDHTILVGSAVAVCSDPSTVSNGDAMLHFGRSFRAIATS